MVVLIFVNVNGIQEVKVVPSLPGNLKIMDNYLSCSNISISMPHLVFFHSVWELDVKPTHVLLCCKPVIVSVEKCELEILTDILYTF